MAGSLRVAWLLQAGLLLLAWPVAAQVRLGETQHEPERHDLHGIYRELREPDQFRPQLDGRRRCHSHPAHFYNPNFLSFNASLYLNQSRANSNFQSISNASGVNLEHQYLRRQPLSRLDQLFQGLQQRRELRCSGPRQLRDPWQQRYIWHQLERESSRRAQLFGGLPDGQQPVFGVRDERSRENSFHSLNLHSAYQTGRASTWAPTIPREVVTR